MSTIAWWYWGCIWTAKLWISSSPSVRKSKEPVFDRIIHIYALSTNRLFIRKPNISLQHQILKIHKELFFFLFNDLIDLLTSIFLWKPRGHEGHFKSIRKRVESVKWLWVNRSHDGKSPSVRSGVGCYSTELKSFR